MERENLDCLIDMYQTYIDIAFEMKTLWFDKVSRECQYFYDNELQAYGETHLINTHINNGEVSCTIYYIERIYEIPSIKSLKTTLELIKFRDEIEILSKEEFVAGLKEQLQDALDNM